MPRAVVLDVLHVTVKVRAGTPDRDARRALRRLRGRPAMAALRAAIRAALAGLPGLPACRVTLSR